MLTPSVATKHAATTILGLVLGIAAAPASAQDGSRQEPAASDVEPRDLTSSAQELPEDLKRNVVELREAARKLSWSTTADEVEITMQVQLLVASAERLATGISRYERLSLEQLIELRRTMEHTVLLPIIVRGCIAENQTSRLYPSIVRLYEALLPRLMLPACNQNEVPSLNDERIRHYRAILELLDRDAGDSAEQFAELLITSYGDHNVMPAYRVYVDVTRRAQLNAARSGSFLVRHFDLIRNSFREHVSQLHDGKVEANSELGYLLTLHSAVRVGLDHARGSQAASYDVLEQCQKDLTDVFVAELIPYVVPIWVAEYQRLVHIWPAHGGVRPYISPMANGAGSLRHESLTRAVSDLFEAWPRDRHELGTIFFDGLDKLRAQYGDDQAIGYMAASMLSLTAPHPTRKAFLVDALREGLQPGGAPTLLGFTGDRPAQVARILHLILLSDHLYFASESSTGYNSKLSVELMKQLIEDRRHLERYAAILTPAQALLVDLLRSARDSYGDAAPLSSQVDSARGVGISREQAQQVLDILLQGLYRSQLQHLFQQQQPAEVAPIHTLMQFGVSPAHPPGPGRSAQWIESLRDLLRSADLIIESQAQLWPRTPHVIFISKDLTWLTGHLLERGSFRNYDAVEKPCGAVRIVAARYRQPRPEIFTQDRPEALAALTEFEHVAVAVSDYAQSVDRDRGNTRGKAECDALAIQYVEVLQRLCITQFALRDVINSVVGGDGPSGPALRRLCPIMKEYEFSERDPKLWKILTDTGRDSNLTGAGRLTKDLETYSLSLEGTLKELEEQLVNPEASRPDHP